MEKAKNIPVVILDGHSLDLDQLVAVARFGAKVELAQAAREAILRSRGLAERLPGKSGSHTASPPALVILPPWPCRRR